MDRYLASQIYFVLQALLWTTVDAMARAHAGGNCKYTRFSFASMKNHLLDENSQLFISFKTLNEAKKSCTRLDSQCKGIVKIGEEYKLANGMPYQANFNQIIWLKNCNPSCSFAQTNNQDGTRFIERVCSNQQLETVAPTGIWTRWGSWGRCSRTCGNKGMQMRRRYCKPRLDTVGGRGHLCNGTKDEYRKCNTGVFCLKMMTDIYGIKGPEGLASIGATYVYSSCVHQQPTARKSCGDQYTTNEDKCNQFRCCFQYFNRTGEGPKCFSSLVYLGSNGRLGWAVWSSWSPCSVSCRNGTRKRSRMCTGDVPRSDLCPGPSEEIETCKPGTCPCDINPCKNKGICVPDNHILSGYKCDCVSGYAGKNCQYPEPKLVCGDDFISVSFEEGIVRDEGLDLDSRLIHFREADSSMCFAEKRGSVFYLSIPPPIDKSCGSNMETKNDRSTVHNQVIWRLTDMYADATVVLVDITCVYEKQINSTIGVGFGILPTIRTISERKVSGAFDINMYLYRDESFLPAHRYQSSPQIAQGELLYISVDLKSISLSSFRDMTILMQDCYVTDAIKESRAIHQLISNGCATNSAFTTVISNGDTKQGRWALRIFDWTNNASSEVFIECRARVCNKACKPDCPSIKNRFASGGANNITRTSRPKRSLKDARFHLSTVLAESTIKRKIRITK